MSNDPWDPARYERFRDERAAPFHALLAEVAPCPGGLALDLGCGTGALTARLHEHSRARLTLGIDSSAVMLAQARSHAGPTGRLAFVQADLASFRPRRACDVVFSNAALHWVPDHAQLIPRVFEFVAPGGSLAIQVPSNDAHASHRIAAEVAREEPFKTALAGFVRVTPVLEPEEYEALLRAAGALDVRAQAREFEHQLASPEDVVTWIRGTTLTVYEERLTPELYAAYVQRYTERWLAELEPSSSPGQPFVYPFRRTFVWARRER